MLTAMRRQPRLAARRCDLAALNGVNQLFVAFVDDLGCCRHAAGADVQHLGGFGLGHLRCLQICRGHVLIACELAGSDVRQLRSHGCALRLCQMSAMEVQADDEPRRVFALVFARVVLRPHRLSGAIAVPAIEDLSLVQPDRLADPALHDKNGRASNYTLLHPLASGVIMELELELEVMG